MAPDIGIGREKKPELQAHIIECECKQMSGRQLGMHIKRNSPRRPTAVPRNSPCPPVELIPLGCSQAGINQHLPPPTSKKNTHFPPLFSYFPIALAICLFLLFIQSRVAGNLVFVAGVFGVRFSSFSHFPTFALWQPRQNMFTGFN